MFVKKANVTILICVYFERPVAHSTKAGIIYWASSIPIGNRG